MAQDLAELRHKVATSMRILGAQGLVRDINGHVSARIPGSDEMFIRCRGGDERGLLYTDVGHVRRLDFNGTGPGLGGDHMAPLELPIHGEIYKARPEVQAVVHAHPYASVVCGILGIEFRPIYGAYDPSGLAIAAQGVPVYPRAVLINRPELGADLIGAMGARNLVLMKGHGITVVGPSVEAATLLALRLENLASMLLDVARMGREAPSISQEDMDAFRRATEPGAGGGGGIPRAEEWTWNHYVQLLKDGVGVPEDVDAP
jgi:ribulose-5-phosphate 4-epimerase/fuculose-1-phosphate aldolase